MRCVLLKVACSWKQTEGSWKSFANVVCNLKGKTKNGIETSKSKQERRLLLWTAVFDCCLIKEKKKLTFPRVLMNTKKKQKRRETTRNQGEKKEKSGAAVCALTSINFATVRVRRFTSKGVRRHIRNHNRRGRVTKERKQRLSSNTISTREMASKPTSNKEKTTASRPITIQVDICLFLHNVFSPLEKEAN